MQRTTDPGDYRVLLSPDAGVAYLGNDHDGLLIVKM